MMMVTQKHPTQQKLFEILQNCKQIPKDDRLVLRKYIREGDQTLIKILSEPQSKRLQVRLRKHLQKQKENKKDCKLQPRNPFTRNVTPHKSPRYSQEKMKKSIQVYRNLLTFKQNLSQKQQCGQTKKTEQNIDMKPIYMSSMPSSRIKFTLTQNDHPETDRYLKQAENNNQNLFTSPDLLQWQPSSRKNSLKNINSIWDLPKAISNNTSPRFSSCKGSQIFIKNNVKFQFTGTFNFEGNNCQSTQNVCHELKMSLINLEAENIFDLIVEKYFSISSNDNAVYLPYRKLLQEIEELLKRKGIQINFCSSKDINIPLLEPFTNQFQAVNVKNLGNFLDKYCLKKSGQIRNLYILLDTHDDGYASLQKFKRSNSWKGQQLIDAFEEIIRKWGQFEKITYWQMYRIKSSGEYKNFERLYKKF